MVIIKCDKKCKNEYLKTHFDTICKKNILFIDNNYY